MFASQLFSTQYKLINVLCMLIPQVFPIGCTCNLLYKEIIFTNIQNNKQKS